MTQSLGVGITRASYERLPLSARILPFRMHVHQCSLVSD